MDGLTVKGRHYIGWYAQRLSQLLSGVLLFLASMGKKSALYRFLPAAAAAPLYAWFFTPFSRAQNVVTLRLVPLLLIGCAMTVLHFKDDENVVYWTHIMLCVLCAGGAACGALSDGYVFRRASYKEATPSSDIPKYDCDDSRHTIVW